MMPLTQREVGQSDNNEARETPYSDASMAWRIGSMFECRKVAPCEHREDAILLNA
jgi:hypothetical protein